MLPPRPAREQSLFPRSPRAAGAPRAERLRTGAYSTNDLAVVEIDRVIDEVAVVASTLTKALEFAKQAVAAALFLQEGAA